MATTCSMVLKPYLNHIEERNLIKNNKFELRNFIKANSWYIYEFNIINVYIYLPL